MVLLRKYMRNTYVDEWDKDNTNKPIRKATYVITPDISDSDSINSETSEDNS